MKRVEYLVEKLDRFANKIGKHNVVLVSFITVVLLITGLYSTFSLFTSSEGIQIIDGLTTFKFVLDPNLSETSVIIPANSDKLVDIVVTNYEDIELMYGIYYNSSNNLSDLSIGYPTTSPNPATGNVDAGDENLVTIKITNNSSSNITLNFGISHGTTDGGDLNLPSGSIWVSTYYNYLSNVKPGSYVVYTGNNGCTGDSCSGQNANYVSSSNMGYCSSRGHIFKTNGWRVGYTDGDNVHLISAGAPDCVPTYVEEIVKFADLEDNYCYSDKILKDVTTGLYKLAGDINCEDWVSLDRPYTFLSSISNTASSVYYEYIGLAEGDSGNGEGTAGSSYSYYAFKKMNVYDKSSDLNVHLSNLNEHALKYCNTDYAYRGVCNYTTTWAMNDNDYQKMMGTDLNTVYRVKNELYGYKNDLIDIGSYYWYASQRDTTYEAFSWSPSSYFIYSTTSDHDFGLRPVIKLDSSVVVTGGSGTKVDPYTIGIHEEDKKDKENKPNAPNLDNGNLIPVVFDYETDTWKMADSTNNNNSWYDYENKRWANALLKHPETIIDRSGNAKHGTLAAAATWDKEEEVVATHASGATDFVNLGLASYNFGSNFSFAIRVKFNSLRTSANNTFLGNWENCGGGLYVKSNGTLVFELYIGSAYVNYTSTETVTTDTWYTIVCTYDGSYMSLYLDGVLLGSKSQTGVAKVCSYPLVIGGNPASATTISTGDNTNLTASDVLVFTRALSESEIESDYSGIPNPSDKTNLLLHYDFSDNIDDKDILWTKGGQGNLAFYTWIPRYKYRVWNINRQAGKEDVYAYPAFSQGIDIMWEKDKQSTGNVECTYNSATTGTAGSLNDICTFQKSTAIETTSISVDFKEAWYTHPAFTFDGREKTGIWVGKFETTGTATIPTILPDVTSLRSQAMSVQFTTSKVFQTYGLSDNLDAHMLTNMQWGAISYLTHSKYGLCDINNCRDIYINNSSGFFTGRSGGVEVGATAVSAGTYDYMGYTVADATVARNENKVASSTGNVTGIYDLVGSAWDLVMSNMHTSGGVWQKGSSAFSAEPDKKYYTSYAYLDNKYSQASYNRARLGDGTAEVANAVSVASNIWKGPNSSTGAVGEFVSKVSSTQNPFFARGGVYNTANAGLFSFAYTVAGGSTNHAFRSVIS